MFRPLEDGGASIWLYAGETALLRSLFVPLMDMLSEPPRAGGAPASWSALEAGAGPVPDAAAADAGSGDLFDDLEKMFTEATAEPPAPPTDPVLARLLPDAYRDDVAASGEFRKYTESSLREAKKYFAQALLEILPSEGGRVRLNPDQARDWMRALNDLRLMYGVQLGVTEEFEEQLDSLDPQDPRVKAFEVYVWLGTLQESLVRAVMR